MILEVRFLWNSRGFSVYDHVLTCHLPEGVGLEAVREGFWITDDDAQKTWSVQYDLAGIGMMWVPPGRITAVVRVPE